MTRCTVSGEVPTNADDAATPTDATRADGQKADHWVMCPGEIILKGFKRPVRLSYQHVGPPGPEYPLSDLAGDKEHLRAAHGYVKFEKFPPGSHGSALGRYWTQKMIDGVDQGCGTVTSMPVSIAETYAAEPGFYGKTFCCGCGDYFRVGARGEFVWNNTKDRVGT